VIDGAEFLSRKKDDRLTTPARFDKLTIGGVSYLVALPVPLGLHQRRAQAGGGFFVKVPVPPFFVQQPSKLTNLSRSESPTLKPAGARVGKTAQVATASQQTNTGSAAPASRQTSATARKARRPGTDGPCSGLALVTRQSGMAMRSSRREVGVDSRTLRT
jgi:hypothetical protein